ncbi:MAG: papain-like cysteine protease family protein [Butyricicoccaceae bacterium]
MRKVVGKVASALLAIAIIFASPIHVYAASKTLGMTRYEQEKSNWCWAASAQMVGKYVYGTKMSQSNICTYVKGEVVNTTATISQVATALYYTTRKGTASSNSYFSLSTSQTHINNSKPFIARLGWNSGGGHAVAIYGYNDSTLYVADPAVGCGKQGYTYSNMISSNKFQSGTGKWTHTAYIK